MTGVREYLSTGLRDGERGSATGGPQPEVCSQGWRSPGSSLTQGPSQWLTWRLGVKSWPVGYKPSQWGGQEEASEPDTSPPNKKKMKIRQY